jgi:PDDEXK-like domain of unknown function (DUF3799)
MKIEKPGIYRDFPTDRYFADPCPKESLSQTIAKIILDRSPRHAWQKYLQLNAKFYDEEPYDKAKAIGNAAHKLMLDRGKTLAVEDFPDFRSKEARAFKLAAIDTKREPILRKHFETASEMIDAALGQLSQIPGCDGAFSDGDAEVVVANCEDGVWLRAMIDWLSPDLLEVWDFKTTGKSAAPHGIGRLMADAGWHIQASMHERILDAIDPKGAGRRRFLYVCQENEPPYALTVNQISEAALTIGRKQLDYAIGIWRDCLKTNRWPAYPPRIILPELPGYFENSWLERELAVADDDLTMAG